MNQHDRIPDEDDQDAGASAVEYGLLVALVAGAIIATVALIGPPLAAIFSITW